jgi:MOSC domain-containing protein YiiM
MNDVPPARVLAIAIKTATSGPMRETAEAFAEVGGGLRGGVAPAPRRGVTLISRPQWQQVMHELAADLPWHTRRANVLLDAERLGPWIGRRVRMGAVLLEITVETKPCGQMDEFLPGLREALTPEMRGGVCAQVLEGGVIRVGDVLRFEDGAAVP